jgi:hypothetical protein
MEFIKQRGLMHTGGAGREIMEETMGRGILLWLLGVPIPIIILLALIWH